MTDIRRTSLDTLRSRRQDVLIIGGGINGAGILRDLALRNTQSAAPLQLGLIEQAHFASGTSGKNSQLIHGGLRYLKYLEFKLVRESLRERSTLLHIAPQFVKPLPFLLPMYGWKSRWMYGAGLALYDLLAGQHAIERHRMLSPAAVEPVEPGLNRQGLTACAEFYDCQVNSARLVLANILDALDHGAAAVNYMKAERTERNPDGTWRVAARDCLSGETFGLESRKIINATGAWSAAGGLRLVRGSHIVIPRVGLSDHAVAYFDPAGRVIFLIPWGTRRDLTLVGTTDVDHTEGPDRVHITTAERDYLMNAVHRVFPAPSQPEIIATFSSLRPLISGRSGSPTSATREHRIWSDDDGCLHVAGGKYTTYRAMSEEAADLACSGIAPELARVHLTATTVLPAPDPERERALEQRLSDHLFVSTYLGYERKWDPDALRREAEAMADRLGWDKQRVDQEVDAVMTQLGTEQQGSLTKSNM